MDCKCSVLTLAATGSAATANGFSSAAAETANGFSSAGGAAANGLSDMVVYPDGVRASSRSGTS